jgi:hypothetical protein
MTDWYQKILEEFHTERNTAGFYKTQGFKKQWNYVKDLLGQKNFQTWVKKLRKAYGIPENGFKLTTPSWTHPIETWKYRTDSQMLEKLRNEVRKFCETKQFAEKDWRSIFEYYIFYNELFLFQDPNSHNMCYVTDILTQRDSLGQELNESLRNSFPVALLISPYASKRDILDYVEKLYKTQILPTQQIYQKDAKQGKVRNKSSKVQARNLFIYQNRNKSLKVIAALVKTKFKELLDDGHIGKIISLENNKRK